VSTARQMTRRLNPPPDWPPPPSGWTPPPGWTPDPSWPSPPPGWQLWIDDRGDVAADSRQYSFWAIAGAGAVLVGSFLPFVFSPLFVGGDVSQELRVLSASFAVILLGLALATLQPTQHRLFPALLLATSGLGVLGYGGFIVMGQVGVESEPSPIFAWTTKVTYTPRIGILLCISGCVAAGVGAVRLLSSRYGR